MVNLSSCCTALNHSALPSCKRDTHWKLVAGTPELLSACCLSICTSVPRGATTAQPINKLRQR